ncbi:hypothetical protein [Hyphomonas oceanitis]|uniref:hypothetical protein n=1 Tax=Hyphomonas oceanitis TaxID=81033 RepID=UPI003002B638
MSSLKSLIAVLAGSASAGLLACPAIAESGHEAESGHHADFKPHAVVGVFVGATSFEDSTEPTYGLEAEYRLTERVGLGAVIEHSPEDDHGYEANQLLFIANYHTDMGLRFLAGAGREYSHGHEVPVWRVGAAYDFHAGDFHISPTVAMDYLEDKENAVFGIVFAKAFK